MKRPEKRYIVTYDAVDPAGPHKLVEFRWFGPASSGYDAELEAAARAQKLGHMYVQNVGHRWAHPDEWSHYETRRNTRV